MIVNRIWQEYFGQGLVTTPEDFGTRVETPSHPELLDWLATEFIRQGWSLKAMHRLIVTSATYRQSSKARPDLATVDHQLKVGRYRHFEFYCDEPPRLGGGDRYPQPLTYLAAGIGF